ncbi:hypothetical protein [Faecalicatena orotica]|uniref:hypothetical protein n=1 Tax=Faecalicatena orotica TaxID=1544 RepID=UPI003216D6B4
MAEMIERAILLSFDELRILLYSMGVRTLEGIYMPEKQFSEMEVIQALRHLSGNGFILAENKQFSIREDLLCMLEIMGHPAGTLVCSSKDDSTQEYFCYMVPDRVVVSQRYWKKKDTLKLTMLTEEEFKVWRAQTDDHNRDRSSYDGETV